MFTIRWQPLTSDHRYPAGQWGYEGFGGLVAQRKKVSGWIKSFPLSLTIPLPSCPPGQTACSACADCTHGCTSARG